MVATAEIIKQRVSKLGNNTSRVHDGNRNDERGKGQRWWWGAKGVSKHDGNEGEGETDERKADCNLES